MYIAAGAIAFAAFAIMSVYRDFIAGFEALDALACIACPTLVLIGDRDETTPVATADPAGAHCGLRRSASLLVLWNVLISGQQSFGQFTLRDQTMPKDAGPPTQVRSRRRLTLSAYATCARRPA